MKRVAFASSGVRDEFFNKCLKVFNLVTWRELSEAINVGRKVFGQYRNGSLTLPYDLFNKLSNNFSVKEKKGVMGNINFFESNWGMIKGGKAAYLKNKRAFDIGRKKAIKAIILQAIIFDINMDLNVDLSYIVGLFIGDGFANKYNSSYIVQFTGQYSKELSYYNGVVIPLGKKYFGLVPKIKKDKAGDILRVNYCSKCLHDFFIKRFDILAGRKSSVVLIPDEIIQSSKENVLSCIAGLYDAEGCFYFVERRGYKRPYPILEFHINNELLVKQVSGYLDKFSIENSTWKNKRIVLYGKKNIVDFLAKVEVRNSKLIEKIPKEYFVKSRA